MRSVARCFREQHAKLFKGLGQSIAIKREKEGGAGDRPRPKGTLTTCGGRRLRYWFIAARRGFTHCVLSFSGGQQGSGGAIS
jgi:hypothetical protein